MPQIGAASFAIYHFSDRHCVNSKGALLPHQSFVCPEAAGYNYPGQS